MFKDYISADLAVFMNFDEFADLHKINGKEIAVIIDTNVDRQFRPQRSSKRYPQAGDGLYQGDKILYVKKTELGYVPAVNGVLDLDGDINLVVKVSEAEGILEITLEANEE